MENETELQDSQQPDEEVQASENKDDKAEEVKEEKDDSAALKEKNKQLFERAKKAETEAKELKAQLEKKETPTPKKEEAEQSNEPDYAKEAFLEQRGVKHPDDKKIIYDEANRLKLPLTDILGMEHMKTKLKDAQTQREAEEGMPDGKGKPGGVNKGAEDYWVGKKNKDGSFAAPPDLELHQKVINKRITKEKKANMFDPIR